MTSTQKSTVILSNPSDWDEWLEIIKTKAAGGEVWEFVDPATAKDELPTLTEPTIPTTGPTARGIAWSIFTWSILTHDDNIQSRCWTAGDWGGVSDWRLGVPSGA